MSAKKIVIAGVFVVDLTCWASRLPAWGETILGSNFKLGPGGKGSNQAFAAGRLGGDVTFITKLGRDTFGDIGRRSFAEVNIRTDRVYETTEHPTGTATIIVDETRGENAIIIVPGSCDHLTLAEIDAAEADIAAASVFVMSMELKMPIVERGMQIARRHNIPVVLNPGPAQPLGNHVYALVDYLTPNESETATLVGQPVNSIADAKVAADVLLKRGVKNVLVTLGGNGVLVKNATQDEHIPAFDAGPVVDTTGAGDAFNGGLAVALAEGQSLLDAVRFGCAVGALSVTRVGTAPSMPRREEVAALMAKGTLRKS